MSRRITLTGARAILGTTADIAELVSQSIVGRYTGPDGITTVSEEEVRQLARVLDPSASRTTSQPKST